MDSIVNPVIEGDPLPPAGARFGPYLLKERIGRGGMAVVYKAKIEGANGFEKTVVVKALLPALTSKPEFLEMFTSEAKTTAQMSHPGIVHVYDFGLIGTTPYLVMEYLDGIDLSRLLAILKSRSERVPVDIAVVIATQVCNALGYAHQFHDSRGKTLQIIHGDVSPSNVMVGRDGSVKLLDFGVSRVLGEFDFDLSSQLKGKFAYMAPEQVRRQPFDRRVDVFAAGITLYEMLTGQRLFFGSSDKETLKRVHAAQVEPPSTYNKDVSPELDAVVLKALKRDPGDRWESGDEMATALMSVSRIGRGRQRIASYLAQVAERSDPTAAPPEPSATATVEADSALMMFNTELTPLKPLPPPTGFVPPPPVVVAGPPAKKRRPPTITMLVRPLVALESVPQKRPMLTIGLIVVLLALTVGSVAGLVHRLWTTRARAAQIKAEPQPQAASVSASVSAPTPEPTPEPVAAPAPEPTVEPIVTPIVEEPVAAAPVAPSHKRRAHKKPARKAVAPHVAPASHKAALPVPTHKAAPATRRDEPRGPSVKDGDLVDPYGIEGDGE